MDFCHPAQVSCHAACMPTERLHMVFLPFFAITEAACLAIVEALTI